MGKLQGTDKVTKISWQTGYCKICKDLTTLLSANGRCPKCYKVVKEFI